MRTKTSATLLVLLLAAVCAVAWILATGEGEPLPTGAAGVGVEVSTVPARESTELEAHAAHTDTPERAPVLEDVAVHLDAAALEGAHWLEGRVVLPEGTPPDEDVFVVAVGHEFPGGQGRRYRVRPDPTGRFRVAFAGRTRHGKVQLEARSLRLENRVRVDTSRLPEELVLEPSLGGSLELELTTSTRGFPGREDRRGLSVVLELPARRGARSTQSVQHVEGGLFRADRLEVAADYVLRVSSDRYSGFVESGIAVEPGECTRLERTLEAGARVEGRVLDEAGAPVPGAEISLLAIQIEAGGLWSSRPTRSDSGGRFTVGGVPAGSYRLSVREADHLEIEQGPLELSAGEVHGGLDVVLPRGVVAHGSVTWPDGTPAPGASVELVIPGHRVGTETRRETTADNLGRFTFGGLKMSRGTVLARARRETQELEGAGEHVRPEPEDQEWASSMSVIRLGEERLDLVLSPGSVVRGLVVDDLGNPLEDFRVVAMPTDESWSPTPGRHRVSARVFDSADGAFELGGLFAGDYSVLAKARDHGSERMEPLRVPWDGLPLEIVLPRKA